MTTMVRETANTVYAAFSRLKSKDRQAVIGRLLQDRKFREDLLDIATVEQRRNEPGRPLREYLVERKKR